MSEDREQERARERDSSARPVTAAARRERRASARSAAGADSAAQTAEEAKGARATRTSKDSGESKSAEAVKKGRPTRSRDQQEKKRSLFGRLFRFLREVVAELRKVIWPTRKQLVTYTVVVLVFVALMVALVSGLDIAFNRGVLWLFG